MKITELVNKIEQHFTDLVDSVAVKDMVTIEVKPQHLIEVCQQLRDHADFKFEQLIDVCGVDYLDYGINHWRTEQATATGFDRGVNEEGERVKAWDKPRFGIVYHLLSVTHRHRLRIKVYVPEEPNVPSVIDVWASANWFEREAFDLFGIIFEGHPDLRRILTDYGFRGHPFRKDFPLIGEVEMRYDAATQRCVYEPVTIQPRVLVPKVIRDDNRFQQAVIDEEEFHG